MNARFMGVIAFAAGLLVPAAVLAQPVLPSLSAANGGSTLIEMIRAHEQMDEFEAKFWTQEPLTQQDFCVQEKQDQQMVAKISAGEPVSSAELDEALKRVETDY